MRAGLLLLVPLLVAVQSSSGCEFNGKSYGEDERPDGSCLAIICRGGSWMATSQTNIRCKQCSAHNDPHFISFQQLSFDFHGTNNYAVALDTDFGVCGKFESCNGLASCLDIITYRDDEDTVIKMDANNMNSITVNGDNFAVDDTVRNVQSGGPTTHDVLAWKIGSCIFILGTRGIALKFCGWGLYIWAMQGVVNTLSGLCTARHPFGTAPAYHSLPGSFSAINQWGESLRVGDDCILPNDTTTYPPFTTYPPPPPTTPPTTIMEGTGPPYSPPPTTPPITTIMEGTIAITHDPTTPAPPVTTVMEGTMGPETTATFPPAARVKRQSSPGWCSPSEEATLLDECEMLFADVNFNGETLDPQLTQIFAGFCMNDLCAMTQNGATDAAIEAWKGTMVEMMETTIEVAVSAIFFEPLEEPEDIMKGGKISIQVIQEVNV